MIKGTSPEKGSLGESGSVGEVDGEEEVTVDLVTQRPRYWKVLGCGKE